MTWPWTEALVRSSRKPCLYEQVIQIPIVISGYGCDASQKCVTNTANKDALVIQGFYSQLGSWDGLLANSYPKDSQVIS